ncbi:hypothetical protein OE88DRAFT_1736825 [Heliocybe sulcata]|uniref:Serine hydrolase domain-containing protein n=1 Tax=Heliocybe sulcata TaxID=5364 RepID=A0A5C3N075_9AGAM|nr:hypothetical protein OE88DRAFT_1736825 [Heliocybe sulcata]
MAAPRRKVLMLHGHSQNANVMRNRTAAIRKLCPDIEFVYLNAPHILWPTDLPPERSSVNEARENEVISYESDTDSAPRAWWHITEMRSKCPGIQEGLRAVRDVLATNEFEGIFGFSQGASMAATVSAILERPYLFPEFTKNGVAIHPPLRFCVAVSGFVPPCSIGDIVFAASYNTPSLHILGRNDVVIREEDTIPLLKKSAAQAVEYHIGGHFVPNKRQWPKLFADFIQNPNDFAISPAVSSPASSVTAFDSDSSPASSITDLDLAPDEFHPKFDEVEELKVEPTDPRSRRFGEMKMPTPAALAQLMHPLPPPPQSHLHHPYPYYALAPAARQSAQTVADLQRQVSELQIFTSYYWHVIFFASFFLPHQWRLLLVLPVLLWVSGRRFFNLGSLSGSRSG